MIVKELTLHLTLPKTVSLNTLYAGKHWTFRKKKKDEYKKIIEKELARYDHHIAKGMSCLLYTSPSPRDRTRSRMPSSA